MNQLAKRDKQLRQISSHIEELNNLLRMNSRDINEKEKSNKYLSNVKTQFKEYEDFTKDLTKRQMNSFDSLKKYLQTLDDSFQEIENQEHH